MKILTLLNTSIFQSELWLYSNTKSCIWFLPVHTLRGDTCDGVTVVCLVNKAECVNTGDVYGGHRCLCILGTVAVTVDEVTQCGKALTQKSFSKIIPVSSFPGY